MVATRTFRANVTYQRSTDDVANSLTFRCSPSGIWTTAAILLSTVSVSTVKIRLYNSLNVRDKKPTSLLRYQVAPDSVTQFGNAGLLKSANSAGVQLRDRHSFTDPVNGATVSYMTDLIGTAKFTPAGLVSGSETVTLWGLPSNSHYLVPPVFKLKSTTVNIESQADPGNWSQSLGKSAGTWTKVGTLKAGTVVRSFGLNGGVMAVKWKLGFTSKPFIKLGVNVWANKRYRYVFWDPNFGATRTVYAHSMDLGTTIYVDCLEENIIAEGGTYLPNTSRAYLVGTASEHNP